MTLEEFPFPNRLERDALQFLQDHATYVELPQKSILFYQGDICQNILLLTHGKLRLYIQDENAESIDLYTLKQGEQCIVNTASTLSATQAVATAEAVTSIKGYLLSKDAVKQLAKLSDNYQSYLFSLYTIRMQSLVTVINDIQFKRLDQRILEWLEKQNSSVIQTTHEAIANALGSKRVVVSRILKELEMQGKVTLKRGIIILKTDT